MIGIVATKVLPSPVFISAIKPWYKAIPPIICESKCLKPNVLFETSRVMAQIKKISSSFSALYSFLK